MKIGRNPRLEDIEYQNGAVLEETEALEARKSQLRSRLDSMRRVRMLAFSHVTPEARLSYLL